MMKYSAYHWDKFRFPSFAFMFGLLYFISSIFGELVNIFNLTNIGDITSLVQNYVALGEILSFEDYFLLIFKFTRYKFFFRKKFQRENFRKDKILLQYTLD
jgi:hypothetical protein